MTHGGGVTVVLRRTSLGASAADLRLGRDLVLDVAPADGLNLPEGVALDDYLDADARAAVDLEARARFEAWRARRVAELTIDGVDLSHALEVELLADCFIAGLRLCRALEARLSSHRPRRIVAVGLDDALFGLAAAAAGRLGVTVTRAPDAGLPGIKTVIQTPSWGQRLVSAAGLPSRVRGNCVCVPYWHLNRLYARFAKTGDPVRPVAVGALLAGINRAAAVRGAVRNGWIGYPGAGARAHAQHMARAAIDALVPHDEADPVVAALERFALDLALHKGGAVLAQAQHVRRAFATRSLRVAVVPFDSPPATRVLLAEAHAAGATSLLVQHGFHARLNDPDMEVARHIALWSERDRDAVRTRPDVSLLVTGNPGADGLTPYARRSPTVGRSIVLVEYPSRLSARIDGRVGMRHVETALQALSAARPTTAAVIRPHPADPHPEAYVGLANATKDLEVTVEASEPIDRLLATADLCVGALSTATLQAAGRGVPVVFLDVTGVARPWPFDGDGLPYATDANELGDQIAAALAASDVRGAPEALEALGARGNATDRLGELTVQLVQE